MRDVGLLSSLRSLSKSIFSIMIGGVSITDLNTIGETVMIYPLRSQSHFRKFFVLIRESDQIGQKKLAFSLPFLVILLPTFHLWSQPRIHRHDFNHTEDFRMEMQTDLNIKANQEHIFQITFATDRKKIEFILRQTHTLDSQCFILPKKKIGSILDKLIGHYHYYQDATTKKKVTDEWQSFFKRRRVEVCESATLVENGHTAIYRHSYLVNELGVKPRKLLWLVETKWDISDGA